MRENKLIINNYKIVIFLISFFFIFKINYLGSKNYKQKLVLHLGNNCFHIHHWLTLILLIFLMYFIRYTKYIYFETLIIIFSAFVFEGLLFGDFYKFFYKNCINI
jgi:hypothetical protein